MIALISQACTIGFSAAAMPGPMQSYLLDTVLKRGWRYSLFIIIAPLFVDIPVIIAVLFALDTFKSFVPQIVSIIQIIGGLFVLYLAWGAWKDFRAGVNILEQSSEIQQVRTPRGTFTRALLLNALSPGPYIFWTTINGPLLLGAIERSIFHAIAFLIAFYGSFLGLWFVASLGIHQLRKTNPKVLKGLLVLVALLLLFFGIGLVYSGLNGLLFTV